ncbi:MAG: TylF/MycF/NovP-related O-methyltransferase [Terriglobia bacterium]
MRTLAKYLLTRVGKRLSFETIYNLNAATNYLEAGRWMHAEGYDVAGRFARREQLFDLVGTEVADREVLYLEFGVYRGNATRYWSKLLRNPASKLHGFDSFEGLPENWLPQRPEGYFSLRGEAPLMDDTRVRFFKGWFEQTLPDYELPSHEVLVLNFDADLYAPTIFVLDALERAIIPGTYIYFDEFNHQFHEMRAFDEFTKRTGMKFSLLGVTRTLEHALFQRI